MQKRALIASLILVTAAIGISLLQEWSVSHFDAFLVTLLRWTAIAALLIYAACRRKLSTSIFVSMVVGAEIGHDFPGSVDSLRILAQIFLQLIRTIIAPLLFGTLVSGIAGHADLKKVGRMGVKALVYFEIVTTLALLIGLVAINISKAGVGVKLAPAAQSQSPPITAPKVSDVILHIFPENIAKSVSEGQILQVVVFSIIFGIALAMVREDRRRPMLAFADSLAAVMFKFTNIVMLFAPIGVGAAIAYTVGHTGFGVLANLAKLLATLYIALIVFLTTVLLPIAWIAKIPVRRFVRSIGEPVSIAFATANSEAALPSAMEAMEGLGIPRQVVAFVMPTGYSFNLDGSSLYQTMAGIFVAQAAGISMTFGHQLLFMLTLMVMSKGTAGVSRASIVILMGAVGFFGLPVEPVFILLGIDQLMDMARTSVNVIGNCLATAVIARWEGEWQPEPDLAIR